MCLEPILGFLQPWKSGPGQAPQKAWDRSRRAAALTAAATALGLGSGGRARARQAAGGGTEGVLRERDMGVSIKGGVPLVIIHFNGMFPNKNHPFWGTPVPLFMETPIQ